MKKKSGEERVKAYFKANPEGVFVGQVASGAGITPGYCSVILSRLVSTGELQVQRVGVNGRFWLYSPTVVKVLPLVCPKCKSPYWNTPRKKLKKEGEGK